MGHHNYEDAKKLVFKGMWLLGLVTIVEVIISLFGKGHLGMDPAKTGMINLFGADINIVIFIIGGLIAALSIYKAYYIIYNFMHMGHEVPGLRMSVLLPTALLIWAIIAFFQEGDSWKKRRLQIKEKDKIEVDKSTGYIQKEEDTKTVF